MKHKYCPQCGSLDMKLLHTGMEECLRCKFIGKFVEGGMDEINALRKSMKPQGSTSRQESAHSVVQKPKTELK